MVDVSDGELGIQYIIPTGWNHIMLNYIANGINGFLNGREVECTVGKNDYPYPPGDGRIVVGRFLTDSDSRYTSVQVDELTYFNKALSDGEISNMYWILIKKKISLKIM